MALLLPTLTWLTLFMPVPVSVKVWPADAVARAPPDPLEPLDPEPLVPGPFSDERSMVGADGVEPEELPLLLFTAPAVTVTDDVAIDAADVPPTFVAVTAKV